MEPITVELEGTLQPDGSLLLDRKPDLPPGRVRVILRSQVTAEQRFWDTMNAIWEGQKARGHVPRSREEVDAALEAERQGWEEHQQTLEQIQDESRKR
ncbi:MAG: hypothetical protein HYS12_28640 [Planctomycetes bacterium]|nr:hypothetical protein [Planctomycetota bacterium]